MCYPLVYFLPLLSPASSRKWQGTIEFYHVRSGIPQGSILGPTLFLLFINDLPLFMNHCETDFFTDDTNLYANSKNIDTIENNLQNDLENAKLWSEKKKKRKSTTIKQYV